MRILTISALLTVCLVGAAPTPQDTGGVTGVIHFKGEVPTGPAPKMGSDKYCEGCEKDARWEEVLVKDGKLENVLLYIKKGVKGKFEPPKDPVVMDQKGCMYTPHIVAVLRNQVVRFRNSDDTSHNIHGLPDKNKEFNISQAKKGMENDMTFKIPEVGMKVKCDVHPWMTSYIHVMKNPYFKVTGGDGKFTIKGLKPGKYTLAAWHETYGEKLLEIAVEKGKAAKADFTYEAKK